MRILVTGGNGFLGAHIARGLLARGHNVRVFCRSEAPELARDGIEVVRGDLADANAVAAAVAGCDLVVHTAAKAGVWGSYESYHATNVSGTRNVLDAMRKHGVGRLVYTSTPSVTFNGRDQDGVDEREPYPARHLCHYAATKAIAEREVLGANGPDLATVALRPHLIWGVGDPHLLPRLLERSRAGKLKLVGGGQRLVDSTCVENAAHAHLLAVEKVAVGHGCAGKAYFLSNGEPLPMRELISGLIATAGEPPVTKSVPAGVAYAAGAILETLHGVLGIKREPIMTRFVARQLATAHWFDLSAIKRELDYAPVISHAEGLARLRKPITT